jgi:hypothetical protein
VGRPGNIIRPTGVDRRATAFEEGAWGGPIIAIASSRLDRLMLVCDAREWTLCTFCTGGVFEVPCHEPELYELRPTAARTPASDGRRIDRHRKERRT